MAKTTEPTTPEPADETVIPLDNTPLAQDYPDPNAGPLGHNMIGGLPHLGHGE